MNFPSFVFAIASGMLAASPVARFPPRCTDFTGSIGSGGPSSTLSSSTPLGGCISLLDETCAPEGRFLKLKNTSPDTSLTWSSRTMELKDQVLEPEAMGFEVIPNRDPKSREPVEITITLCK